MKNNKIKIEKIKQKKAKNKKTSKIIQININLDFSNRTRNFHHLTTEFQNFQSGHMIFVFIFFYLVFVQSASQA